MGSRWWHAAQVQDPRVLFWHRKHTFQLSSFLCHAERLKSADPGQRKGERAREERCLEHNHNNNNNSNSNRNSNSNSNSNSNNNNNNSNSNSNSNSNNNNNNTNTNTNSNSNNNNNSNCFGAKKPRFRKARWR